MSWQELRSGKDRVLSNAEKATAAETIAELLWNALDAEATTITARVTRNELGAATSLTIIDNGSGIPHCDAHDLFLTEGDSWKKDKRFSPNISRPMHGQLGRGRLLIYSIADRAEWSTVAEDGKDGPVLSYKISGSRSKPAGFEVPATAEESSADTGTTVTLHLRDNQKAAQVGDPGFSKKLLNRMAESISGANCSVVWDGVELDPESVIDRRDPVELPDFGQDVLRGHEPPTLVVVEWSENIGAKRIQLCDDAGAMISDFKPAPISPTPFSWTAYLKWKGFRDPELMGVADLHAPEFQHSDLLTAASERLTAHLANRLHFERGHIVSEWKEEGVYPYKAEPKTVSDTVERELFDVVAVIASASVPKRGTKQKQLTLRLLREALRSEPARLREALEAVVDLSEDDQESLQRLLKRTELGALVRAASKVNDRLDFVNGLASLLYADDTRKVFREVDQLHPLLVNEPWVFGDQWDVCLSEHGLTRVVESVVKQKNKDAVLSVDPVKLPNGKQGRVDLLFHKVVPESERHRHLVVELKRPGKLTMDHYAQVTGYATAITKHPEVVNTASKWDFWLVGSDLDETLENERSDSGLGIGFVKDYGTHRLWVLRWGELLDGLRLKYESYRSELGVVPTTSTGIEYLRRVHNQYLPDEVSELGDREPDEEE